MKLLLFSTTLVLALGTSLPSSAWGRGPAGGMGYGALAGTSNPPRAGLVTTPNGLYGARPYTPGQTYGPAFRNYPTSSFPSTTTPQGALPYRTIPRTNPPNPHNGPSYYYFRR